MRLLRNIAVLPCALLLASASAAIAAPDKIRIAFVGDSLAQNYVAGVTRLIGNDACLKGRVDIGRFARPATGLANSDYYNWPREVRRVVEAYRPNLTVISIGMNDRQGIIAPDGKHIMWGAPEWTDRYRRQIVDFLQGAAATKASVLFVGLPAMRADYFNADRVVKNRMYAEAVAGLGAANVRYLEPWKLNASGAEPFPSHGPDPGGRRVQIRTSDGVHFASGGEDMLAQYLLPKIVAALADAGIPVDLCLRTAIAD